MRFYRGRASGEPRLVQHSSEVNGPMLWRECECGKWIDNKTGEHVEIETLSLREFMDRHGPKCPAQPPADAQEGVK